MTKGAYLGRRRLGGRSVVLGLLIVLLAMAIPESGLAVADVSGSATTSTTGCSAPPVTSTSGVSFTASETLCRSYFDQGVVDVRNFQLNVSNTQGLRNGQVISVSWSGAHPTGGLISDEQLNLAAAQEYPVVLMECRGVDSPDVPASEQITPETCWTASAQERVNNSVSRVQPMWKLDMYNSADKQANQVGAPVPYPAACGFEYPYTYWVPFVAADGTNYPIGTGGCAGSPPEMLTFNENPSIVPSNTTYAETAPDGTGSSHFTITTAETNQSLGCSQTVACSLVVIPIEGISCNANPTIPGGAQYDCENPGDFQPGVINQGQNVYGPALSDQGQFWWSGSNWGRRISVPLNFATPADACAANSSTPIEFYGSEVMVQATEQWNPHFCLDPKLFNVEQVQLAEPQAKRLVQQGFVEAAFQGAAPAPPPGSTKPFATPTVQAPVAVSGFGIAYVIDNADGTPYTQLKLNPRLLAKMLTESYYGTNNIQSGDLGISSNPQSIFDDPEFLNLNPTYTPPAAIQPAPAATLFSILTQSDSIWGLTSYITDDPEARAWLDGQPDPWGMTVNPYYRGIQLPLSSWPLLDTSTNGPDYTFSGNPLCVNELGSGNSKIPDRPLIDNPGDSLLKVAINLEFSIAASLTVCNGDPNLPQYVPVGPEVLGQRFLIGLVALPEAKQLDLDMAQLQTHADPEVESRDTAKYLGNRAFVGPSTDSLHTAAGLLQPDAGVGSWALPYQALHSDSKAQAAYPGTMLLSADIPTSGLPAADAQRYGQWLDFAATDGQAQGTGVGQIPAGYLPMTAADGMSAEVAYTKAAALDVTRQNGQVPSVSAAPQAQTTTTMKRSTTATTRVASGSDGGRAPTGSGSNSSAGASGDGSTIGTSTASGKRSGNRTASPGGQPVAIVPVGRTVGASSPVAGVTAVVILVLGLAALAWTGLAWVRGRRGR